MEKELNINGSIYRLVEEEKQVLKAGEWISTESCIVKDEKVYALFSEYGNDNKGFGLSSVHGNYWCDDIGVSEDSSYSWKSANMEEVERLLITKAAKEYPEGTRYNDADPHGLKVCGKDTGLSNGIFSASEHGIFTNNQFVFSYETGLWAEIIEEKKPLYHVRLCDQTVHEYSAMLSNFKWSDPMSKLECHKYIIDKWDELNK